MAARLLLSATHIAKSYAGVQALRDGTFELHAGEVHAIVGENGAGKSTLIKVLSGAITPDSGELTVNGDVVRTNSPRMAKAMGIACIYQQPALFPELTVAENIALGAEPRGRFGHVDWTARTRRAVQLLQRIGARVPPEAIAGSLSMPMQQLVEIARALGANAKILILDEPTASLSADDSRHLLDVLRELRAEGVGIVYISHRLEELSAIADRVTVLRDGATIGTALMSEVSRDQLIQMMVGREVSTVFPKRRVTLGDTVLSLYDFGARGTGIHGINLSVRAGEIVGLAGLVGAGRTELARIVFGLDPADCGRMHMLGKPVQINSPGEAIQHGIAYVPEDRRNHGVVLPMSVSDNVSLATLGHYCADHAWRGLNTAAERANAGYFVEKLGVKTASVFAPVSSLSGGNQQKVALARWLSAKPRLLILDEPTQGIDVGAKAEIHGLITDLAAQGVAVLMISSELPEILGMSDRIAVMRGGTIVRTMEHEEATAERVLSFALGQVS